MKKPISFILILCMVLAMMPMMSITASAEVGETFTANITVGGEDVLCTFKVLNEQDGATPAAVQIGGGTTAAIPTTAAGVITIPPSVSREGTDYTVTKIGDNAFNRCYELTGTLTIPASVTEIGDNAFYSCEELTGTLTIPASVTEIGDNAFYSCEKLTGTLTIPAGVTSIGNYAFYNCRKLSGLQLTGDALETIGSFAFYNCGELTGTLTIPASVTTIGASAFEIYNFMGYRGFSELEFEADSQLLSIGNKAFSNNNEIIGTLTIPASVTTIGEYAFSGCTSFSALQLTGSALTSIGRSAFNNCGFTGPLTIPDSIATIEQYTFQYCDFTGPLNIPASVTTIGAYAFDGCTSFSALQFASGSNLTLIERGAFQNCSGLTGSLNLPASVTSIERAAFYSCSGLTGDLIIPSSVSSIGSSAFSNCSGLTGDLIIPSSVSSIGSSAFSNCSGLTGDLTIPEGVTAIYDAAFRNCSGLDGTLTLPASLTYMGAYVFTSCSGLTGTLTIPASVSGINTSAFEDCSGFTALHFASDSTLTSIMGNAFKGCSGLTGTLTIPASIYTMYNSAFEGCGGLTALELQGISLPRSMGTDLFNGCSNLDKLFIPAAWTGGNTVDLRGIATSFAIGADSYSLVKVAGLTSVLGESLSVPESGTGAAIETPITWPTIEVGNEVTRITTNDIAPATSSTAILYSNPDFNANEGQAIELMAGDETIAYIKVTSTAISSDPVTTRYHKVTINRAAAPTLDLSAASVTITAPVRGAAPQDAAAAEAATSNSYYTVTGLTWNEDMTADGKFKASQVYTATVTLTSKNGKKFQAESFTPTVSGAASVGTTTTSGGDVGNTVSFTVTYAATAAPPSNSGGGGGGGSSTPATVTKIESGGNVTGTNLDNLVKEGKKLTVEGRAGEKLVFDTEALKNIDGQTKDSLKVEIKDVSTKYKEEHPDRLVVSLTITAGGKHITSFGNGTATVSLPYELKEGEKAKDVTVWYLAEDGTMTEVPCTYDETTKLATFKVNHFSLYVVGTADTGTWINPFSDVKESSWFYDAVRFVSANELMNGTTDTAFNPGAKTTRGMIVTILWRMENEPKASKEMTFTDVKDGRYYRDAVAWASEKGIVGGYSADLFGAEDNITREQLAVILHNYASFKGYNIVVSADPSASLSAFSDAGALHSWSKGAMSWANGEGLINGTGSNLLDPLGAAERCQVAAILQRFIENTAK